MTQTLEHLRRAYAITSAATQLTPLLESPAIAETVGARRVFVKAESLQRAGSFKIRGAYAAMTSDVLGGARPSGVVAHSSGNHAQAVAYAAGELGVRAVLVIPHDAPEVKVRECGRLGAEVVLVDPTMEARTETAAAVNNPPSAATPKVTSGAPPITARRSRGESA